MNDIGAVGGEEAVSAIKQSSAAQSKLLNDTLLALSALLNEHGQKYIPYGGKKSKTQMFLHPEAQFMHELKVGTVSYRSVTVATGSSHTIIIHQGMKRLAQIRQIFDHVHYEVTHRLEQQWESEQSPFWLLCS